MEEQNLSNDLSRFSDDLNQYALSLATMDGKASGVGVIPDFVPILFKKLDYRIQTYNSADADARFGVIDNDDAIFMEAVTTIAKLANALQDFHHVESLLSQTNASIQRAIKFLEDEFRSKLDELAKDRDSGRTFYKFLSIDSKDLPGSGISDHHQAFALDILEKLHRMARTMALAGYEAECGQVFLISRRNAIRNCLNKLDYEALLNLDDVKKLPWESFQIEVLRWINVVKTCSEVIFPAEKRLAESIFPDSMSLRRNLLSNIARVVVIQLLDFAEASMVAKPSMEKMFKYLDMYEALQQLIPAIGGEFSSTDVTLEVTSIANRIGESAATIFCEIENTIKSDVAKSPVPGGAVHPLTRYVMNYLKQTCPYKNEFQKIFESASNHNRLELENGQLTAFSIQALKVMDLLDTNLDQKSKLYKDPSLHHIFLMNNGRFILQKVKGSAQIEEVLGQSWCRKRSSELRQYHKNYQRETWTRVLNCFNQEGLMERGKVNKPLLKERFKVFNSVFDDIHRTQSTWVVSDEQLQMELKISISSVVIPAYRSFIGRFRQYFSNQKQVDKYIKYQPEDIETLIEGLFQGNPSSLTKKSKE